MFELEYLQNKKKTQVHKHTRTTEPCSPSGTRERTDTSRSGRPPVASPALRTAPVGGPRPPGPPRAPPSSQTREHSAVPPAAGAVLKAGEKKGFVAATEMNVHGDALCFTVKTLGKTQDHRNGVEQWLAVGGWWRLVAVGGWRSAVGGGWRRLATDGGWQLVVGGGWRWLAVVGGRWGLSGKKKQLLRTALPAAGAPPPPRALRPHMAHALPPSPPSRRPLQRPRVGRLPPVRTAHDCGARQTHGLRGPAGPAAAAGVRPQEPPPPPPRGPAPGRRPPKEAAAAAPRDCGGGAHGCVAGGGGGGGGWQGMRQAPPQGPGGGGATRSAGRRRPRSCASASRRSWAPRRPGRGTLCWPRTTRPRARPRGCASVGHGDGGALHGPSGGGGWTPHSASAMYQKRGRGGGSGMY